VDDHDPHPEGRHEDDVDEEMAEGIGVFDDAATELDDGGRVAELADPPEGLDEGVGLLDRLLLGLDGGGGGGPEAAFREWLRPGPEGGKPPGASRKANECTSAPRGLPSSFFSPVQWVMGRERGPGPRGRPT
jgi:hypothetical protein